MEVYAYIIMMILLIKCGAQIICTLMICTYIYEHHAIKYMMFTNEKKWNIQMFAGNSCYFIPCFEIRSVLNPSLENKSWSSRSIYLSRQCKTVRLSLITYSAFIIQSGARLSVTLAMATRFTQRCQAVGSQSPCITPSTPTLNQIHSYLPIDY